MSPISADKTSKVANELYQLEASEYPQRTKEAYIERNCGREQQKKVKQDDEGGGPQRKV